MIQAVILEDLGMLKRSDLAAYCTPTGKLGVHPDYGIPGIEASTGSLGHGPSLRWACHLTLFRQPGADRTL
jgi:transketolase